MAPDTHSDLTASVRQYDVPNEILLLIFRQLHKEDLKSARLVCKLWSLLPLGLLFDRIYISPHSVNVKVFKSIAAHPLISRCVKELIYDGCDFRADLPRHAYFNALCDQLHGQCSHLPQSGFRFETPDEQLNKVLQYARYEHRHVPRSSDDRTSVALRNYRVVYRGHQAYLECARQQQEYHNGGELLVHLSLGLMELPALDAVVLDRTRGDSLTDSRFDHTKPSPIRKCGSPLARTWNPLFLKPGAGGRCASRHVGFFTLIRGLSLSQRKVSKFKSTCWLNLEPNTLDTKALTSPSLLDHTVKAFRNVERLTFDGLTLDSPDGNQSTDTLAPLLRSMSALKHLSLDMGYSVHDNQPFTLVEIMGSHHPCCNLVYLRLAAFTADEANLLKFLVSLEALRDLNLQNGELTCGNWASALEQFRLSLRLQTLTLEAPLLQLGEVDVRVEDEKIERYFRYGGENPLRVDSQA